VTGSEQSWRSWRGVERHRAALSLMFRTWMSEMG
jgi:hypothetical protein